MGEVLIHRSVRERWDADPKYRPRRLREYTDSEGWRTLVD
jgi:hypothetical protein